MPCLCGDRQLGKVYSMRLETSTYAMSLFDRFCSAMMAAKMPITVDRVQDISRACFMLAAKFYDVCSPNIDDLAQGDESSDSLRLMELEILEMLEWKLCVALPHTFFAKLLPAVNEELHKHASISGTLGYELIFLAALGT